jgi:P pilus assembly chaperone PapD
MLFFLRVFCLLLLAAVFAADHARALGVTPLIVELSSGASNRTTQIMVENDNSSDTPIEIEIFLVDLDENGGQHLTPAPSEFVVFPPSRMLKPHSKQVFRVQWAGAPLAKSQTFIFAVNQLPVKMPGDKSGVQVLFNFDVIANVAPPSGTRSLEVLAAETVTEAGKRYASLLIGNSGNVHAKLSDATLTLRSGSWSQTVTPGELQLRLGAAVVQPGKRRRFRIPVELPAQASAVTAEIAYPKGVK